MSPAATVIRSDVTAVAGWAVDTLLADLRAALDDHGAATWVATGGSTPLRAYELLAERPDDGIAWDRVTVAMGDERCVPLDDPDSNWGQMRDRLAGSPSWERARLLVPPMELDPDAAAERYAATLGELAPASADVPRLEHLWLGMGEDGHTLSLFPGQPQTAERAQLVVAVRDAPKPPPTRISLTLRALQRVDHCVVLVTGAAKSNALRRALADDEQLPIARAIATVRRAGGRVTWVLDEAAADGAGVRAAGP